MKSSVKTTPPPKHLDAIAAEKWREILPLLEARGDVDQGSLDAAAAYCVSWATWTEAQKMVDRLGTVVKTAAGLPAVSPYVTIAEKAQRQMRQWLAELRLTPKSRKGTRSTPSTANGGMTNGSPFPLSGLRIIKGR